MIAGVDVCPTSRNRVAVETTSQREVAATATGAEARPVSGRERALLSRRERRTTQAHTSIPELPSGERLIGVVRHGSGPVLVSVAIADLPREDACCALDVTGRSEPERIGEEAPVVMALTAVPMFIVEHPKHGRVNVPINEACGRPKKGDVVVLEQVTGVPGGVVRFFESYRLKTDAPGDNGQSNDPSDGVPHVFWEETRFLIGDVPAGATIKLQKYASDTAAYYRGAVWVFPGSTTIENVLIQNNKIFAPMFRGIDLTGSQTQHITFEGNEIDMNGAGTIGVDVQASVNGSGKFTNNVVKNSNPGSQQFRNGAGGKYVVTGSGNSW